MNGADTAWMLISTALVLLMTPALGFFYGGLVRSKNALNTIMMSVSALGFLGIAVALLGRNNPLGIAFGALLFGFLDRAAIPLQFADIPASVVTIIQGTIVLAVVVAGLIIGHNSPYWASGASRLQTDAVWRLVDFLLEGFVFLLIGQQLPTVIRGLSSYGVSTVVGASARCSASSVSARLRTTGSRPSVGSSSSSSGGRYASASTS